MINKKSKSVSKLEEAIEFYNQVLALDNDEAYIINLVKKLSEIFIGKVRQGSDELCFLPQDLRSLGDFERSCMKFIEYAKINLSDGGFLMMDKSGTIISFDDDHEVECELDCGKNVFEYLTEKNDEKALNDARNVINQNLFSSKLYQAVGERLYFTANKEVSGEFIVRNRIICSYADKMSENHHFKSVQRHLSRYQSAK